MKKKVVSLVLSSVLIGSLSAETNSNEDVLNNVLSQLLKDQPTQVKEKVENKKVSESKVVKVNNEQKVKVEPAKVVSENKVIEEQKVLEKTEVVEQPNLKLIEKENVLENILENNLMNEDLVTQDIHSEEKVISLDNDQNSMFLLNVPLESEIRATIDIILPPYREQVIYYEGKLVSENPFNYNKKVTYCYLNLETSGVWRRFKAEEDKFLKIISNVSSKNKYQFAGEKDSVIEVYETVFTTDNKHIKQIVCESSEKSLPLTIGDLNDATGGLFKFTYTPMVDI